MGLETFMQRILRKFERFIDKKLIFDSKFSFNGFLKIQKNSKFKNFKKNFRKKYSKFKILVKKYSKLKILVKNI